MKYWETLKRIFRKKVNWLYLFILFFAVFWLLRIIPHWEIMISLIKSSVVSWNYFFDDFYFRTLWVMSELSFWNNFLAFAFPISISLNIILFKELYLKQEFILKSKSLWASLSGMFFGLFGVGCAACSGLLLAPLISFLGLSWVFQLLPYGGEELAWVGLLIIIISIIYLLKKISDPITCSE